MSIILFSIKLLSNNEVILIESEGYEAEIFIPVIKNRKITLQNVTESKRCFTPFFSTPKNNKNSSFISNIEESFSSMDVIRKCKPQENFSPFRPLNQVTEFGLVHLNKNVSLKNININSKMQTTHIKELYMNDSFKKPFDQSQRQPLKIQNIEILQNLTLPPLPNFDNHFPKTFSQNEFTPIVQKRKTSSKDLPEIPNLETGKENLYQKALLNSHKKYTNKNKIKPKSPPKTITKWRKCLTPIRTYSKKADVPKINSIPPTPRVVPLELITLPDYARNPTVGIDGDSNVLIKKHKFKTDNKIFISPKSFKKQLKNADGSIRKHDFVLNKQNSLIVSKKNSFKYAIYDRPYELLTNFSKTGEVSNKLKDLYKERCVNKTCSTKRNYLKLIGEVPPLETEQECIKKPRVNLFVARKLNI